MTRLFRAPLCFAVLALATCGICAAAVGAQGIAKVRTAELPSLPDDAPLIGVVAIHGRAVALQSEHAWILTEDRKGWTEGRWQQPVAETDFRGVIGDGERAFVLMAPEGEPAASAATLAVARVAELRVTGGALALHPLPAMPVALSHAVGASHDGMLFLAGRDASGNPYLLQLLPANEKGSWNEEPAWPGGGSPTSIAVQNSFAYLTVPAPGAARDRLLRWSAKTGWEDKGQTPAEIVPGSARALGQAHILYLVRDADGASRLVSFHTISSAWADLPYRPAGELAAIAALGSGMLTAHGEGGRTTFQLAELESGNRALRVLDWIVIIVYLAAMIGVGLYFKLRGEKGTPAEFFVGSRAIPVWAAGISLYATNTSSISYVAIPAKSFETNWTYLSNNLITVLGLMFVATWVVPLLRRLELVSVFSYLEMRFHPAIRVIASALCILMQVGSRMSVVLFLPALAIAAITGLDVVWSILIMGVSTIIYTALGGMRAVIWTDVLQVIVMFGGALFAIGFVFYTLGGGAVLETALVNQKTKLFDFSLDLTHASVWGFIILMLLDVVLTFPKDQVLMQRALATKSERSAGRSIWVFALMTIPGGFVFYSIGTALFAYYQARPDRIDPLLPIDATFPLFIAAELPVGITGLIIAGIFAAAMSTLSGTINSVATLLAVDFYGRAVKNPTQESSLRFAEWMSVLIGLIGMGLALLLTRYDVHSLLDMSIELAGLLGGGFAGAYTLGMFTRRANTAGVTIGIAAAIFVTMVAWAMSLVHPYFYLGISILVCIVVGYFASLLFPAPTRSLAGLTVSVGDTARG